eukprot:6193708-Pleurochrysis_carterae.AAC.1
MTEHVRSIYWLDGFNYSATIKQHAKDESQTLLQHRRERAHSACIRITHLRGVGRDHGDVCGVDPSADKRAHVRHGSVRLSSVGDAAARVASLPPTPTGRRHLDGHNRRARVRSVAHALELAQRVRLDRRVSHQALRVHGARRPLADAAVHPELGGEHRRERGRRRERRLHQRDAETLALGFLRDDRRRQLLRIAEQDAAPRSQKRQPCVGLRGLRRLVEKRAIKERQLRNGGVGGASGRAQHDVGRSERLKLPPGDALGQHGAHVPLEEGAHLRLARRPHLVVGANVSQESRELGLGLVFELYRPARRHALGRQPQSSHVDSLRIAETHDSEVDRHVGRRAEQQPLAARDALPHRLDKDGCLASAGWTVHHRQGFLHRRRRVDRAQLYRIESLVKHARLTRICTASCATSNHLLDLRVATAARAAAVAAVACALPRPVGALEDGTDHTECRVARAVHRLVGNGNKRRKRLHVARVRQIAPQPNDTNWVTEHRARAQQSLWHIGRSQRLKRRTPRRHAISLAAA